MEVILSLILLSTIFFIWRWRSEVFDRLEKAKAKIADYEAEIDRKDAEIIAHREQISRLQQKLERSQDEERQKFETRIDELQAEVQEKQLITALFEEALSINGQLQSDKNNCSAKRMNCGMKKKQRLSNCSVISITFNSKFMD